MIFRFTMKYNSQEINFLPSSLVALLLKGMAISSVFLARASLYWAADQSFNLSSISGVQHVGPVGQICNETPEIDKLRWLFSNFLRIDHLFEIFLSYTSRILHGTK